MARNRILTERDDVAMMRRPDLWPCHPVLPLKNRLKKDASGFPELGVMVETTEHPYRVYLGSMDELAGKKLDTVSFEDYLSPVAAVAAGWVVD